MAQRVQTIPYPRFRVPPLETTGAAIVSVRRVMFPATNATTYSGINSPIGAATTTIILTLADNECFIPADKFLVVFDFTLYGPWENLKDTTNGRTYGRELCVCFDQGTQAMLLSVQVGSPQGLIYEVIQNYNLWANILSMHAETSLHKEISLLDWCEFDHSLDKNKGLNKTFDGTLTQGGTSKIAVGETVRMFLRLHHLTLFQAIGMIPLFLLRNGLQIQLSLESAYKVFYSPSMFSDYGDVILDMNTDSGFPSWFIGNGVYFFTSTAVSNPVKKTTANFKTVAVGNVDCAWYAPPIVHDLKSNFTGNVSAANYVNVPTFNTLWLGGEMFDSILSQLQMILSIEDIGVAHSVSQVTCVPVSFYEKGTVVWQGFCVIDPAMFYTSRQVKYNVQTRIVDQWTAAVNPPWQTFDGSGNAGTSFLNAGGAADQWVTSNTKRATDFELEGKENTAGNLLYPISRQQQPKNPNAAFFSAAGLVRYGTTAADYPEKQRVCGVPLYSYNDQTPIPYILWNNTGIGEGGVTGIPTAATLASTINNLLSRSARVVLHVKDTFFYNTLLGTGGTSYEVSNPGANGAATAVSLWSVPGSLRTMRYTLKNVQGLVELVKPAAPDFLNYQQQFESAGGIAYAHQRILYRKNTFAWAGNVLQLQIPISVRSLTGLIFVIQDPACASEPADMINCLLMSNLSTFQSRNLTSQVVNIGGQSYPIYTFYNKPDGQFAGVYGEAHIVESEKYFGVTGSASFNPSFHKTGLKKVRNLLCGGLLGNTFGSLVSSFQPDVTNGSTRATYTDTTSTVFAFSLAKDDVNIFTTGVDSSMAGSISATFTFRDQDANYGDTVSPNFIGSANNRTLDIHVFARCDQLTTIQSSNNNTRF